MAEVRHVTESLESVESIINDFHSLFFNLSAPLREVFCKK
jgi:hypothetical protein